METRWLGTMIDTQYGDGVFMEYWYGYTDGSDDFNGLYELLHPAYNKMKSQNKSQNLKKSWNFRSWLDLDFLKYR